MDCRARAPTRAQGVDARTPDIYGARMGKRALTQRFHVDRALLNRGFPTNSWGNLGLWETARTYPQACEALAVRLGERAQLTPGCRVLDVGFGHGDQLLVWRNRFGVGHITGIEVSTENVAAATQRALEDVELTLGSATDLPARDTFDRVLALDCAYHFEPRSRFLEQAHRVLAPGGRLALNDLCVERNAGPLAARVQNRMAQACHIPPENLMTVDAYVTHLTRVGFTDVQVDLLDDDVLVGFSRWATRHLRDAPLSGGWPRVLASAAAGALVRHQNWMHYVAISATRSS